MNINIAVLDPFLLSDREGEAPKCLRHAHCKGGGGGSSKEYERQLREQREAREKAEAETAELKNRQNATESEREKRAKASYLTGGGGAGINDESEYKTKKSYLGSGS